jgi:Pentaxin family./Domain of unknown function (DUF1735).
MKQKIIYIITTALLATAFWSCEESAESFDNHIFIDATAKVGTILMQGNDSDQASFQVVMPKPETYDVKFAIRAEAGMLATYNEAYYDDAIALPAENYIIENTEAVINAGTVRSSDIQVIFTGLSELDRQQKYVLPVSIANADVNVLESGRTIYYLIKGAALINVVGDLEENNVYVDWADASDFRAMRQFTSEALVYVRNFDRMLTTVMGIEGKFLIRIGDAGIPSNQLQVATSNGNYSSEDLLIPMNEWVHIAVAYDADATSIDVYINGRNIYSTTSANVGTVDWGIPHSDESGGQDRCFWIGYAYDNNRYLAGLISECRVWNRVLTSSEINEANHFYYVDPDADGLIAYWKFNDGGGNTVTDHSAKGNHATASNPLIWADVELPIEE